MKQIISANGRQILVDDTDYETIAQFRWYTNPHKGLCYAFNSNGDSVHGLIMQPNTKTGEMVDHIDGNGLNNKRDNLRICTCHQNILNSKSKENATSKFKGVKYNNRLKKWIARISYNYQSYLIGEYDTENEAALAYNQKAIELHKGFARLNIIKVKLI